MLTAEEAAEIFIRNKEGDSIRYIAEMLCLSRNTVRKYVRNGGRKLNTKRAKRAHKLDPYKPHIDARLRAAYPGRLTAVSLLPELQGMGYTGGITRLRQYLAVCRRPA